MKCSHKLLILFVTLVPFWSKAQILATEPLLQPSSLVFNSVKSYRIIASFTIPASPAEGYLVLRKNTGAITEIPTDGITYERGDKIGNATVVQSSASNSFIPNQVIANATYYFAVYAYNGSGNQRNYRTVNPLTGNVTTTGSMLPANYYDSISVSDTSFITKLHNLTYPHVQQTYSNYASKFIQPFLARDTVNGKQVVSCVYSGENKVYTQPWSWTTTGFSREHTYCQSWMPTVNAGNFDNSPEYSDYHQLFPVNQNKANAVRSNYPLGEVVSVTDAYKDAKFGLDKNGQQVYEPRDAHKGDAARALMYQAICYNGISGNNWGFPNPISATVPYGQNQEILKKWHYQDPPDNFEIARNDFLDSLQKNRNPFIDVPEFACYINFNNMRYIASPAIPCNQVSTEEQDVSKNYFSIAANPNDGHFELRYIASSSQLLTIRILSLKGTTVYQTQKQCVFAENDIEIKLSAIDAGLYFIELKSESTSITQKLIIIQ